MKMIPEELKELLSNKGFTGDDIFDVVDWLDEFYIYLHVEVICIGSDEWEFGYVVKYIPLEFHKAKRRCAHFQQKESENIGTSSYSGLWRTRDEAYLEGIKYVLKNILSIE